MNLLFFRIVYNLPNAMAGLNSRKTKMKTAGGKAPTRRIFREITQKLCKEMYYIAFWWCCYDDSPIASPLPPHTAYSWWITSIGSQHGSTTTIIIIIMMKSSANCEKVQEEEDFWRWFTPPYIVKRMENSALLLLLYVLEQKPRQYNVGNASREKSMGINVQAFLCPYGLSINESSFDLFFSFNSYYCSLLASPSWLSYRRRRS